MSKKIYFFIGTTTELIKLAPIMAELEKRKIKYKVITSGQTKVKFEELAFLIKKSKADIMLGEKANKSSIIKFIIWSVLTIFKTPVLRREFKDSNSQNTYFIVHGDPVSSLIGAIVAKLYGLKLVHIESGLRSFNYLEPFPEEICRQIISKLSDYHFAPNSWALNNLKHTGGQKINTFENTMFESYVKIPKKKRLYKNKYFVLIVHRQEHVIFDKDKSKELIEFIFKNIPPNMKCVFIRHATTANFLESVGFKISPRLKNKIIYSSRMKYVDFVNLIRNSEFLITDGGSNQEEAYYMGLPCLLVRNYTERIEGLGENVVLSKNNKKIIKDFMSDYQKYKRKEIRYKKRPSKIVVERLMLK